MGPASLPGKSRPPWTTERCSMRSKWAWTGATHGSPKNHRSLQHLHGVCALPAHVTKTMMVTRRKPPPHLPPTAYRPLTPHSPAGEGAGAPRKVPRTSDYGALFDAFTMGLDGCNPRFAETHRSLQHPGKSRPPWTTVRCSMRSMWAWTGATQGSPKLTGLFSTVGKSRAPWTTVRCSVRSLWAWTGATQGSPKLTGLCSTRESPATEHALSQLL